MKLRDPNGLSIEDGISGATIDWESEGLTSQQRQDALSSENREIPSDPAIESMKQQM